MSKGDIQKETKLCLETKAVLEAEGASIENIAKVKFCYRYEQLDNK